MWLTELIFLLQLEYIMYSMCLKECKGQPSSFVDIPEDWNTENVENHNLEPEYIVERGLIKKNNVAKVRLLIKWGKKTIGGCFLDAV